MMRKLYTVIIYCLCIWIFAGCGHKDEVLVFSGQESVDAGNDASVSEVIYVHVCGAVKEPGVVELPPGSRAEAALMAAGGFAENGARDYVNLAALLEDGQKLYFPTVEEAQVIQEAQRLASMESADERAGKININTAREELLCTLPGIGQTRAQAIIAYRHQHGDFAQIEDIMLVPGIKQSAFDKLCDRITVE